METPANLQNELNQNNDSSEVELLRKLLEQVKLSDAEKRKYLSVLEEINKKIIFYDQYHQSQHTRQAQLPRELQDKNFFKAQKQFTDNFKISAALITDIHLDDEQQLEKHKIKIRKSGRQGRHPTPISLIERVFLRALVKGSKPQEIIQRLELKIDFFIDTDDQQSKDAIQNILDGYKGIESLSGQRIGALIKILAMSYHTRRTTFLEDNITPRIYECYLVPTLATEGNLYIHQGEGSFVVALLKILDGFEEKTTNVDLNEFQIAQMNYAIFAIFDFLPLPENTKNKKEEFKRQDHRYVGESIERLFELVGIHLSAISEAYPGLYFKYRNSIQKAFYFYVAEGVSEANLTKIFKEKIDLIFKRINQVQKVSRAEFELLTNAKGAKGFAQQYNMETAKFIELLSTSAESYLKKITPDINILGNSDPSEGWQSAKVENTFVADIQSCAVDILYLSFLHDKEMNEDFSNFKYFNDLCIKKEVFVEEFNYQIGNSKTDFMAPNATRSGQYKPVDEHVLIRRKISDAYRNSKPLLPDHLEAHLLKLSTLIKRIREQNSLEAPPHDDDNQEKLVLQDNNNVQVDTMFQRLLDDSMISDTGSVFSPTKDVQRSRSASSSSGDTESPKVPKQSVKNTLLSPQSFLDRKQEMKDAKTDSNDPNAEPSSSSSEDTDDSIKPRKK